jgi:hypothetical protein
MSRNSDDLHRLAVDITSTIERADDAGLITTTYLLKMAKLDLLAVTNDINDEELKAFSEAVERVSNLS